MKKGESGQRGGFRLKGEPRQKSGFRLTFPLTVLAATAALGIWHYQDVRDGALACGDLWLMRLYPVLLVFVVLGLAALGWGFFGEGFFGRSGNRENSGGRGRSAGGMDLARIYPAAGLLLGIVYLFVLPPLFAPDEISHYVSAYQLSSRMLGQPSNDRYGRVLLRPEDAWVEDLEGIRRFEADEDGVLQVTEDSLEGNIHLGEVLDESMYQTLWELGLSGQYMPERLDEMRGEWVSSRFPPVVTTPLAYVPSAVGIVLARLLGMTTVPLLYLGRFCNLLFFVAMTWLAMRRLPFGREVLFGVALLPMTQHLSASFSYDVMILGCMFCFTAVCLDLAYKKEKVGWLDVAVLAALMAAAGPCKMVYAVMMGLCLLIPVRRFGGWGRWALAALAVGGAWAVSMYLVNSQVIVSYATETERYVMWAEEPGYSLALVLHQPLRTVKMFYQTILWQAEHYHLTMIGAYLGNLDKVLDVPYLVVAAFTLGLLELAFRKPGESLAMSGGQRVWVCLVCAGCALVTMASMLIAWTPISAKVINGVQGRYFLPFLPVLLMALKNDTVVLTKNRNRSILYLMCCLNGYVLMRLFSVVSMRL